MKEENKMWEID